MTDFPTYQDHTIFFVQLQTQLIYPFLKTGDWALSRHIPLARIQGDPGWDHWAQKWLGMLENTKAEPLMRTPCAYSHGQLGLEIIKHKLFLPKSPVHL